MNLHSAHLLSISASPATKVISKPYYDLPSTVKVMKCLLQESTVDGFEVQNLAEWNKENPPRDDVAGHRYASWEKSPKYTHEEVAALLEKLPVLSIHANRDVGICLCSEKESEITKGKTLIHESLSLAEKVGASVCVFHLWDTRKPEFDIKFPKSVLNEIAPSYTVRASVENVPVQLEGFTPFDLVEGSEWVTLDIRWAALYHELEKFESIKDTIVNVHLRGDLEGTKWVLRNAPFGFYEALITLKNWGYSGLFTMEPEGGIHEYSWEDLVAALFTLRYALSGVECH